MTATPKTTYTAGPWTYQYGAVYAGETRIGLADREEPKTRPTERDSNVRLMAAAPDLLDALRMNAETIHEQVHMNASGEDFRECPIGTCRRATAAIAKAEG